MGGGGGSGGMFPQKILKIRRSGTLFSAISVIYLLRSFAVCILYSHASMEAYSFVIHDSFSHLSLFMIPKF